MNFFSKTLSRIVAKAINPDIFAFYYNRHFPPMRTAKREEMYTSWTFACINAIAGDVAMMELISQRRNTEREWTTVADTDALKLLRKPNPIMTGMDILFATEAWKHVDGNSYWYVAYNAKKQPIELWPVDPQRVVILKDEITIVGGYQFLNMQGKFVDLDLFEMIHFKTFNPDDAYVGKSTLQAASTAIETDVYTGQWNKNYFKNSAIPDAVLQTDKKLSTEVYKRIKASWHSEYGGISNAHKTAILEEGLNLKPTSLSHKDMDFLNLKNATRDDICAFFRVPKLILGFVEGTNRASAETIEYVYTKKNIMLEMQFLVDKLNAFYLPLWGVDPNKERIWYKNPVADDEQLLITKKNAGIQYGYYKYNEVRAMDNLPPVPGGDVLYIPTLVQPLPANPKDDSSETSDGEEPSDEEDNQPPQKRIKSMTQTYQKCKVQEGKKEIVKIYDKMKDYTIDRLTSQKSMKGGRRVKSKPSLAQSLRKALSDDEDGAVSDTTLADNALSGFIDTFSPEVLAFIEGFTPEIFQKGGSAVMEGASVDGVFDLKNPRAVAWLQDHALELATEVPKTIKGEMAQVIQAGVDSGASTDTIRDNIIQFYEDQSSWRAERVARTEVTTAYEQGSLEGAKQSDFTEKMWEKRGATSPDICNGNEEQGWIGITENFISGHDCP
ncbi:MAG: phage portal protein, partial [Bryobacteraceae bacterium]